jgi:hypothetical protein
MWPLVAAGASRRGGPGASNRRARVTVSPAASRRAYGTRTIFP